jgi:hypothetical protein
MHSAASIFLASTFACSSGRTVIKGCLEAQRDDLEVGRKVEVARREQAVMPGQRDSDAALTHLDLDQALWFLVNGSTSPT